jgi:hypothetical protein
VAYGARLESVLGASPHGFESHILRERDRPHRLPGGVYLVKWIALNGKLHQTTLRSVRPFSRHSDKSHMRGSQPGR